MKHTFQNFEKEFSIEQQNEILFRQELERKEIKIGQGSNACVFNGTSRLLPNSSDVAIVVFQKKKISRSDNLEYKLLCVVQ